MALDMQCSIVNGQRITRPQALAFTANHPIGQVAGSIYDYAVSLGIDPAFALAEAILETGWGTSGFAQNRHNWFAYTAYFENPDAASSFESDDDGIRIPLEDMKQHYFTPGGTYYADGDGTTLAGWAKEWVDGGPAHWKSACRQILSLMPSAMQAAEAEDETPGQ